MNCSSRQLTADPARLPSVPRSRPIRSSATVPNGSSNEARLISRGSGWSDRMGQLGGSQTTRVRSGVLQEESDVGEDRRGDESNRTAGHRDEGGYTQPAAGRAGAGGEMTSLACGSFRRDCRTCVRPRDHRNPYHGCIVPLLLTLSVQCLRVSRDLAIFDRRQPRLFPQLCASRLGDSSAALCGVACCCPCARGCARHPGRSPAQARSRRDLHKPSSLADPLELAILGLPSAGWSSTLESRRISQLE